MDQPDLHGRLPQAVTFVPKGELKERVLDHVKAYDRRVEVQNGKRKAETKEIEQERSRLGKMSRSQITERMVSIQELVILAKERRTSMILGSLLTEVDVDAGNGDQPYYT